MSLIARAIEESGIATMSMSSARDITRAAWPPRSVYLDYPLGHTSGRPHSEQLNNAIMRDTLAAFEALSEPGAMVHLSYHWAENDEWKDAVFAPLSQAPSPDEAGTATSTAYEDDRSPRYDTPQYQSELDAAAAAESHADEDCLVCAGIDY